MDLSGVLEFLEAVEETGIRCILILGITLVFLVEGFIVWRFIYITKRTGNETLDKESIND